MYIRVILSFVGLFCNGLKTSSAFCVNGAVYLNGVRKLAEEQIQSCLTETTDSGNAAFKGRQFDKGFIIQSVIEELAKLTGNSIQVLQRSEKYSTIVKSVLGDLCPASIRCPKEAVKLPYRTLDGSCNNLNNPTWGMSFREQRRHLPPRYSDGVGRPRMYSKNGDVLPSARAVSNMIHKPQIEGETDSNATTMVMAYGQFLDHDLVSTPVVKEPDGTAVQCCSRYTKQFSGRMNSCFHIEVPKDDPHFSQFSINCMSFVRSAPAVCSESNTCICQRQQINQATSYIDASSIYGSNAEQMKALRSFSNGMLLNIGNMLPETSDTTRCSGERPETEYCFLAGDFRVNTVPNLSSLHTIFMREHNRIAVRLAKLNKHWNDDKIFNETRKIMGSQQQNIVYSEYLPVVLGHEKMAEYKLKVSEGAHERSYDNKADATITNSFSAASFRFGHASAASHQMAMTKYYTITDRVAIESTYHNPHFMHVHSDEIARWLANSHAVPTNGQLEKGVRDMLFPGKRNSSFDLAALNIQRGRDHGIPGYNHWRRFCRLSTITVEEFQLTGTAFRDHSTDVSDSFRNLYSHPDDIDLFSGASRELPVAGGQVGPTFACLLGLEFRRLKEGDRFYFENPTIPGQPLVAFTEEQVLAIKRQRFAQIVCINTDTPLIQKDIFRPPCPYSNPLVFCNEMEDLDLTPWNE